MDDDNLIYGFDTDERAAALAALLVYITYRSRDVGRMKVTPDFWGRIQRFVKASAKRARTVGEFVERLKPRLGCSAWNTRWMRVGEDGALSIVKTSDDPEQFTLIAPSEKRRPFFTRIIRPEEQPKVLSLLRDETEWVTILVRERLERERDVEREFKEELAS